MNIKYISIILIVFFLTITVVSANNENITNEDNILSVTQDYEYATMSCEDNASLVNDNNDCLSVSNENTNLNSSNDNLSISNENTNLNSSNDSLSISNENTNLNSSNKLMVSVSVESKLSVSHNQSILSIPINQEDSKLSSIYDKVYSKKDWRTVGLFTIKYKYSWSAKKINKVTNQVLKSNYKKIKTIMKAYLRKGWTFSRVYYTLKSYRTSIKCYFYLQFYRTIYYNGYGDILYVC